MNGVQSRSGCKSGLPLKQHWNNPMYRQQAKTPMHAFLNRSDDGYRLDVREGLAMLRHEAEQRSPSQAWRTHGHFTTLS